MRPRGQAVPPLHPPSLLTTHCSALTPPLPSLAPALPQILPRTTDRCFKDAKILSPRQSLSFCENQRQPTRTRPGRPGGLFVTKFLSVYQQSCSPPGETWQPGSRQSTPPLGCLLRLLTLQLNYRFFDKCRLLPFSHRGHRCVELDIPLGRGQVRLLARGKGTREAVWGQRILSSPPALLAIKHSTHFTSSVLMSSKFSPPTRPPDPSDYRRLGGFHFPHNYTFRTLQLFLKTQAAVLWLIFPERCPESYFCS